MTQNDLIADYVQTIGMDFENQGIDGGQVLVALDWLQEEPSTLRNCRDQNPYWLDMPAYAREVAEDIYFTMIHKGDVVTEGEVPW